VVAAGAAGFALVLDGPWAALALAVVGALLGFLVWNRPPARIYLGDAGSYLLGVALAVLLARAFGSGEPVALGAGSLLFVAVPVADTAVAIVRRARARRPLFVGDRSHVYDQLVDRGRPATVVTLLCAGVQLILTAAGVGITALPGPVAAVAAAVVVVAVATPALVTFARAA
jgi:UDP-GlcNAc:undecaprenyl-phosphate GlcNAc-1-phosphate transferase